MSLVPIEHNIRALMGLSRLWEALKDPKAIVFFLWPALSNLIGGIGVQYSLIIHAFGFSVLQTTLLSIPAGASQIIGICVGGYALRKFPVCRNEPFSFLSVDCLF